MKCCCRGQSAVPHPGREGGINKFRLSQIFAEGCNVHLFYDPDLISFRGTLGLDMFVSTVTRKRSDLCRSSTEID